MRWMPVTAALLVLAALVVPPSRSGAQADSEFMVLAHPTGPPAQVSAADLEAIFTSRMQYWPSGQRIAPFNLPAGSRAREFFDRALLRMSPDQAARFWIDQRIRGGERPPRQIPSDDVMLRVIARLPGSVGYVQARAVPSGVRVLARVRNGAVRGP